LALGALFDDNQRNIMIIKWLRHKQQRSMFPQKSPLYPPFRAILPPFCHPFGFESARGHLLSGTRGKRVATFALVTTVRPEPRPARSTPAEPGRAADRQAFASLSYPTDRQVVRNPHVGRPGFLVSTSIHPRTAVRPGRRVPASHTELPKTFRTIPSYIAYDKIAGVLRASPEK